MLLCAITNRCLLGETEAARRKSLVAHARKWAGGGVDFLQIREKDLPLSELQSLTIEIVDAVKSEGGKMLVLVNGPPQPALNAGADGVHLPGSAGRTALSAAEQVWSRTGRAPAISVSCHSVEDVRQAYGASLLLFAPVFEKVTETRILRGQGLGALREACLAAGDIPVLALGGVTAENAAACVDSGATGVAAIRLFLTDAWRSLAKS
jgi:thiamine-phosphate pyrophosphorylase